MTLATKELIEDEFVVEPRGPIPIKGKGEMEAWYLIDRREHRDVESQPTSAHPIRRRKVVPCRAIRASSVRCADLGADIPN